MQRSTIGVGPVLRRARVARGVSIDQAARDTKIRSEFLDALEDEDFDRLLGDVYVRGCLRSYATYLGLSADTIVAAYAKNLADPMPPPQTLKPPATEPVVGGARRRDSHRLFVLAAVTVLVLAAAFGVLSTRSSAPPPAAPATVPPLVAGPAAPGITVAVEAREAVDVTVHVDGGGSQTFSMDPGESRAFDADQSIVVRLARGASAHVTVNGVDHGFPGNPNHPWKGTFSYGTEEPTSSPSG